MSDIRYRAFRTNSRNQVGYQAGLDMPIARPNPFNSSLPPDLSRMPYTVTSRNETEPLVMLPVSLGILALAIIFLGIGIGASKANSTWTGVSLRYQLSKVQRLILLIIARSIVLLCRHDPSMGRMGFRFQFGFGHRGSNLSIYP